MKSGVVLLLTMVLLLTNCQSNSRDSSATPFPIGLAGVTTVPAIELTSYPCPETPPAWVSGSPAICGTHPASAKQLPVGIENGAIVSSNNLLWFIWENTKTRIWFPNDAFAFEMTEGDDITGQLVGKIVDAPEPDNWEIMYSVDPKTKQTERAFLADQKRKVKFGVQVKNLSWEIVKAVPTTIRAGYRPIPRSR